MKGWSTVETILREREKERERRSWFILACAYIRRSEHPLYFILPPREIPADSYSLERNKRWPSFSRSLHLPPSVRKRGAQLTEELPLGLLLHSTRLLATDELPGLFFLREPLPVRTLFFFLVPRPHPPRSSFLPFFLSFLSFPFLVVARPDLDHGIMQRITEKSKQANDHEIHAYHPPARYTPNSFFFFFFFLSSFFFFCVVLCSLHFSRGFFFDSLRRNTTTYNPYYLEDGEIHIGFAFRKWRASLDARRS